MQEAWLQRAELLRLEAKFGDMNVSDAQRLKALEPENTKPKKLLACSSTGMAVGHPLWRGRPTADTSSVSGSSSLTISGSWEGRTRLLRS